MPDLGRTLTTTVLRKLGTDGNKQGYATPNCKNLHPPASGSIFPFALACIRPNTCGERNPGAVPGG
jgi:hypothetical protein